MYHLYTREELRKEYRTKIILYTATAFTLGFTIALAICLPYMKM